MASLSKSRQSGNPQPSPRRKRRFVRAVQTKLVNPVVRMLVERTTLDAAWALLETTGRKSGEPRRVPVGNGLRGNEFWIVTEHGYSALYVKNIQATRESA